MLGLAMGGFLHCVGCVQVASIGRTGPSGFDSGRWGNIPTGIEIAIEWEKFGTGNTYFLKWCLAAPLPRSSAAAGTPATQLE
jgi:hypothetical protein